MSRSEGNRRVSGGRSSAGRFANGNRAGAATQFQPGVSGNAKGRPRTKIIRDFARRIVEESDPTGRQTIAEECVRLLLKFARRGSLGHLQQFLQLVESDAPGAGWPGDSRLDVDAIAKLTAKICRTT